MVEASEAHDAKVGHGQGILPPTAAPGAEIHRADVPVVEFEVERRLIDGKTHCQVILGRSRKIRDHRVSVEKEIGAGCESHEWVQRHVIVPNIGIFHVGGGEVEESVHGVSRNDGDQDRSHDSGPTALAGEAAEEPCGVGGKDDDRAKHPQPDRRPCAPAHALVSVHRSSDEHEKRQR